MRNLQSLAIAAILLTAAACGRSGETRSPTTPSPTASTLERAARADSVRRSYTQADVDFMTGMIHHHAQALVMARMAPTHEASSPLQVLAARIINGQKDEIALMQQWLRDHGQPVPEVSEDGMVVGAAGGHGAHAGHGGHHAAAMPGMLTPAQMERLGAARGAEWDRLFLTFMIQHHQGALTMVDALFATYGAGQGDAIFKIAADIGADQASEIDRMQLMLHELMFGPGSH
ncbi:MAG TPA: DUF305 domain-containing protein [Longimicrobiales bacterium]|nr:DUF305 domain-containing protein [Longimicrobiales bacterium]